MKRVNDFIDLMIPKNIPAKKRNEIADELKSHICDKIDFYMDIGYDKESSIKKSLTDFGEENEIKEKIRSDFEELYHERWYFALLAGIVPLILNLIAGFTGMWLFSADYAGEPSAIAVAMSLIFIGIIALEIYFLYSKGLRKSLVAVGISNLIIAATLLVVFYPQAALYGFSLNICYILDRFTPWVMKDIADSVPGLLAYNGSFLLLVIFAIICFSLARKIKNKGNPPKKSFLSFAVFSAVICAVSFVSAVIYVPAENYFDNYPEWFHSHDTVTYKAEEIYDNIHGGTNYEDVKAYLQELGYVSTEDYVKTLDSNTAKKFRYNLKNMHFFFDDGYEIFFSPERNNKYDSDKKTRYSNGFVFISKDKNGKICGKGIGLGAELTDQYGGWNHYCSETSDVDKCITDFSELEKGDDKETVLSKIGNENGHFYTKFTTYTESGQQDYFRIHCYGYPYEPFNEYEKDRDIYIEFYFNNNKLTAGVLYYNDYSKGNIENIRIDLPE